MSSSNPELLAPLNDWKTLAPKLKVLENADSVYFGIKSKFSMRSRAGNFSLKDLSRLSKHVHDQGKKLYLCTNIVIYNNEIQGLHEVLESAYSNEIDSVICYDFASIQLAQKIGLDFHISTQMNISNLLSAQYFESIGASSINLARELNLNQIKEIASAINIPVECFVHGAMCTAVSGRCYFSAEVMGSQLFSANRGKCQQHCRRFYTFVGENGELLDFEPSTGRFFNAKDLCMIEHLDSLINANISSFKIEGRMRDPLYISETVKCYREAINSIQENSYTAKNKTEWMNRLLKVYNRGFHTGFYFSPPDPGDIELKAKGNISEWKRKMVGTVTAYISDSSTMEVKLTSGSVKIGENLVIQDQSGFYTTMTVENIVHNGIPIKKTMKASSKENILISMTTNEKIPLKSKVFKIQKVQDPIKD